MTIVDSLLIEIGVDASQVEKGINESRQSVFAMGDFIRKWWRDNVDKTLSETGKNVPKEIKLPDIKAPPKQAQAKTEDAEPERAKPADVEVEAPDVNVKAPNVNVEPPNVPPEPPEDKEPKTGLFDELKKALRELKDSFKTQADENKEIQKTPVKPTKREKMVEPEAPRREDYDDQKDYDKAFSRYEKKVKPVRAHNRKVDEDYRKELAEYKDKTEEITRAKKELNRAEKENEDILGRLTARLRDVAAGYLTVNSFVKQGAKLSNLRDLAKEARVDVKELDAWGRAFRAAGYDAEAAQNTVKKLKDGLRDLEVTGQSQVIGGIRAVLGEEGMTDENGQMKDYSQLFADYVKELRTKDEGFARFMAEKAGFDQQTINLMLDKSVDIEKLIEKQKQFAASGELGEAAKDFQRTWGELMDSFSSFGNVILKYVLPPITAVVKGLTSLIQTIVQSDAAVWAITAVVGAFAMKFTFLGKVVRTIIGFIAKFGGKLGSLGGIFAGFAGWIKNAIGMIGGLGSKIGGLISKVGSLGDLFKKTGSKGSLFLELGANAGKLAPFIARITGLSFALYELYKFFTDGNSIIDKFLQKIGVSEDSIKSIKETFSWHPDKYKAAEEQTGAEKHGESWGNETMFDEIEHPTVPHVASYFYGNRSVTINNETNIQGNISKPEDVARAVNRANENYTRMYQTFVADGGVSA